MGVRFPGESEAYRAARDRLLAQELALRRTMEAVAEARRALPPGGVPPEDYVFTEAGPDGAARDVRLSELFAEGQDTLAIYSFMFPRAGDDPRPGPTWGSTAKLTLAEGPCPSCVALIDQFEGAAEHLDQRLSLVIAAKAPWARLEAFARERGWSRLRFVSCADNAYSRDYLGEDEAGSPQPMLNVFTRRDGVVRHFWGSELFQAPVDPGQDPRHLGTIEPLWTLLDLTPEGRIAGWEEQLDYACCAHGAGSTP